MPDEPVPRLLSAFEICLLLTGTWLLLRLAFNPAVRARWLGTNRMPAWTDTAPEFGVYFALMLISGFFFQTAAQIWLGRILARLPDRNGWELVVYGLGFHGGALVGWLLFRSMREGWRAGLDSAVPPVPAPPRLAWSGVVATAAGFIVASLPAIFLVSLGWGALLRQLGLPDDPQDSIAIFSHTKSPLVVVGMFVVACVVAPLNEELLFRAGLFRFCRGRLGRSGALALSAGVFGAVHFNWAGFLPLALLGAGLAVIYEATGSIRVAVVAHGLFNLMNIVFIVFGGAAR